MSLINSQADFIVVPPRNWADVQQAGLNGIINFTYVRVAAGGVAEKCQPINRVAARSWLAVHFEEALVRRRLIAGQNPLASHASVELRFRGRPNLRPVTVTELIVQQALQCG